VVLLNGQDNNDQLHCPKASLRLGEMKISLAFWHNATVMT
jgi:hypothetical protein